MTLKQKQALLAYLGCYDGPLDGLWGEKSQRATIDFQRSYMEQEDVDGIFGAATEKRILEVISTGEKPAVAENATTAPGWWKDIRYFTRAEFRCPCGKCGGFPVEPDEKPAAKPVTPVKIDGAKSFSTAKNGKYRVQSSDGTLNLRSGADVGKALIETMHNGTIVRCYGYHTGDWLYVVSASGNKGYCHGGYLERV